MATEILIRFGLQALKAARENAKEILRNIKEAAKSIKDVGERKAFVAFAKEKQKERLEEIEKGIRLDTLARTERLRRQSELGQFQPIIDKAAQSAVSRALNVGHRLGNFGSGVATLLTQDDPTGTKSLQLGLHTLAASGVPIASQLAAVVSQVVSIIDAQEEKRIERIRRETAEAIDRRLAEADTEKRYREDVQFKARLDREAQNAYASQVAHGWQPRGSRLNDGDF